MAVDVIPLDSLGLVTVDEAARMRGVHRRTVQNWIAAGLIPAVAAGGEQKVTYLLRRRDVERFNHPAPGRPAKTP